MPAYSQRKAPSLPHIVECPDGSFLCPSKNSAEECFEARGGHITPAPQEPSAYLWRPKGETAWRDWWYPGAAQPQTPLSDEELAELTADAQLEFPLLDWEYVLSPIADPAQQGEDAFDGWFTRGAVSLIAGSSGAGKTTLMTQLLDAQRKRKKFLGHQGVGSPYLIVFADRGQISVERSLKRMGLLEDVGPHCAYMNEDICFGRNASVRIVELIEARKSQPAVVFLEGADVLVEDPSKTPIVAAFLKDMQKVAKTLDIAVVLSLGSPKAKPKEQHTLKRDRVFGSQIWSRLSETVVLVSQIGDGTSSLREVDVQHRDAGAEKFAMKFGTDGLLHEHHISPEFDPLRAWVATKNWFTRKEAAAAMKAGETGMSQATVYRRVAEWRKEGLLDTDWKDETELLRLRRPVGEGILDSSAAPF